MALQKEDVLETMLKQQGLAHVYEKLRKLVAKEQTLAVLIMSDEDLDQLCGDAWLKCSVIEKIKFKSVVQEIRARVARPRSESATRYRIKNALVLLIGISKYSTMQDLNGAKRDVANYGKLWKEKYGYRVLPEKGSKWYEKEEWTFDEIEGFIEDKRWELLNADKELAYDALIVSINGHGNNRGILPSDFDEKDNQKNAAVDLLGLQLKVGPAFDRKFAQIPRIFFVDACRGRFKGGAVDVSRGTPQTVHQSSFVCTLYGNAPGLKVREDANQGGYFSQCLIEELRVSADMDRTLSSIAAKLKSKLDAITHSKQLCWIDGDPAGQHVVFARNTKVGVHKFHNTAPSMKQTYDDEKHEAHDDQKLESDFALDAVHQNPSSSSSIQKQAAVLSPSQLIMEQQFLIFLQSANMEQYANKFRESECFDMQSIPFFDDEMLREEIGIFKRMPRKRFLNKCSLMKKDMDAFKNLDGISDFWYNQLSHYGVVTLNILCTEINDPTDIQTKYAINDEAQCHLMWAMVEQHKKGTSTLGDTLGDPTGDTSDSDNSTQTSASDDKITLFAKTILLSTSAWKKWSNV